MYEGNTGCVGIDAERDASHDSDDTETSSNNDVFDQQASCSSGRNSAAVTSPKRTAMSSDDF